LGGNISDFIQSNYLSICLEGLKKSIKTSVLIAGHEALGAGRERQTRFLVKKSKINKMK
jgi:hypothetical protein